MLNKVRQYINDHRLLDADKRYLVALSGGADSVCLLLVLKQLGYQVEAAHCNFLLRGDESHRDEAFARALCDTHDIPFHVIHFDTRTYASLHKVSIEMAARDLRYQYFENLRRDIQASGICVAHHQDDSVETILMNLLRGTGIHGLSGIKPRNGYILRPLLCVSRKEIEAWLAEHHQTFVTDSTNLEADVVRNKLRLNVIPLLQAVTPSAVSNILKTAQHLSEATTVYDHYIEEGLRRLVNADSIAIDALLEEPSPESLLHQWLSTYGFPSALIERIWQSAVTSQSGAEWSSATHQLTICRGKLIVEPKQAERPTLRIPETGVYIYDETAKIRLSQQEGATVIKQSSTACLDAEKVRFPLILRPITSGDRFTPFGMKGSKLVSDYLTDLHLSIFEKRRTLVLCQADGTILWLAGHRPDARFCVTSSTHTTLIVTLEN
jgi:tRNA(Ile)-lysidine synthase